MKKIINSLLYPTCTFFTFYVFLFLLIGSAAGNDTNFIAALTLNTVGMLLLLSLSLALLNCIFMLKSLNSVLKVTLHFIGFIVSYGVIVWGFGSQLETFSPSMILLFLLILSVLYFIILFAALLLGNTFKQKASENENYSSILKSRSK